MSDILMVNMTEEQMKEVCQAAATVATVVLPSDASLVMIVVSAAGEVRMVVDDRITPAVLRSLGDLL